MGNLIYEVVNTRTQRSVAAFLLITDAQKYIDSLESREGVHGPRYEILAGGYNIQCLHHRVLVNVK